MEHPTDSDIEGNREDRDLPFVVRVAAEWSSFDDMPQRGDGAVFFAKRLPLTGLSTLTSGGNDIHFSDLSIGS
jgi:hypothetical protein